MHVAQSWRLKAQRYSMQGAKCENCGKVTFPPREVCPHCANKEAQQHAAQIISLPVSVLDRAAR